MRFNLLKSGKTFCYGDLIHILQSHTGALEGAEIDGFIKDMMETMRVSSASMLSLLVGNMSFEYAPTPLKLFKLCKVPFIAKVILKNLRKAAVEEHVAH